MLFHIKLWLIFEITSTGHCPVNSKIFSEAILQKSKYKLFVLKSIANGRLWNFHTMICLLDNNLIPKIKNPRSLSLNYFDYYQGRNQGGGKGAEAPPLSKSKLRKKIKYRIVLIFLVSVICELRDLTNMVLKIDYVTVKLQSHLNASSKWRHKIFHFQVPSLAKSWLRLWS